MSATQPALSKGAALIVKVEVLIELEVAALWETVQYRANEFTSVSANTQLRSPFLVATSSTTNIHSDSLEPKIKSSVWVPD